MIDVQCKLGPRRLKLTQHQTTDPAADSEVPSSELCGASQEQAPHSLAPQALKSPSAGTESEDEAALELLDLLLTQQAQMMTSSFVPHQRNPSTTASMAIKGPMAIQGQFLLLLSVLAISANVCQNALSRALPKRLVSIHKVCMLHWLCSSSI